MRPSAVAGWTVQLRVEVAPAWPFRLGPPSGDGLLCRRGRALHRLLHLDGEPVLVGVVQPAPDCVVIAARAHCEQAACHGIERMRFCLGVDDDLSEFHAAFRRDPLIGPAVRRCPTLRAARRPRAWEALVAAITEQLIEVERAIAIQRRLIRRLGRRCAISGLRDAPTPAAVAGEGVARMVSLGLAERRAISLRRVSQLVARGSIDLDGSPEAAWRALRTVPGIGAWTVEYVALHGHGRYDQAPAGDLGFLKIVGRLVTGNPRARAEEADVRGILEPYGRWRGLAGSYLMWAARNGLLPARLPAGRGRTPVA